jgi:antirestriction protein ArdC
MTKTKTHFSVNTINDALRKGIVPWSRSFRLGQFCGLPMNCITGEVFTGIMPWILETVAIERGYQSRCWGKKTEWECLEGKVDRASGVLIVQGGREVAWFNRDAVDVAYPEPESSAAYDTAQRLVEASGAWVKESPNPRYLLAKNRVDWIAMPRQEHFLDGVNAYWFTYFHEMIHWASLHPDRVGWEGTDRSQWELIADLGAAILMDYCDLPIDTNVVDQDHLPNWIAGIDADETYFIDACSVSHQAANYLLSKV